MSVHSYFRRIRAAFSAGGLNLVLFKIEDKVFKTHYSSEYIYRIFEAATPQEFPELVQDCVIMGTGRKFDIYNPQTFNEKIQWIKVFDSTPLKTRLADKYLVRDWITEKIGAEYLVPLLGVWDSFDDIDFNSLPNQFVLKCNHGSGWNIIVKDKSKLDLKEARCKLESWIKKNYAFKRGELQYLNIPPKIIAEQYLENINQLYDYKIMCFNGEPKFLWVDEDRFIKHKRSLFSLDWKPLPFKICEKYDSISDPEKAKPESLDLMIDLARTLCQGFAHVRIDFYAVDGKVYFGEMTFTSTSGLDRIVPEEWNNKIGNMLILPPKSPIPSRKRRNTDSLE